MVSALHNTAREGLIIIIITLIFIALVVKTNTAKDHLIHLVTYHQMYYRSPLKNFIIKLCGI